MKFQNFGGPLAIITPHSYNNDAQTVSSILSYIRITFIYFYFQLYKLVILRGPYMWEKLPTRLILIESPPKKVSVVVIVMVAVVGALLLLLL